MSTDPSNSARSADKTGPVALQSHIRVGPPVGDVSSTAATNGSARSVQGSDTAAETARNDYSTQIPTDHGYSLRAWLAQTVEEDPWSPLGMADEQDAAKVGERRE